MSGQVLIQMLLSFSFLANLAQVGETIRRQDGFSTSANEHIVNQISKPFRVRVVHGSILLRETNEPLPDVLFEVKPIGGSPSSVKSAKTDQAGKFSIRGLRQGNYLFKATREGFQSAEGKIIVTKKVEEVASIDICLGIGE